MAVSKQPILVTGAAGFIGYHLIKKLTAAGASVIGIDNLNSYYSVDLKQARLKDLKKSDTFTFRHVSIENKEDLNEIFQQVKPKYVVNLAAQAGVRYSLENPDAYIQSNLVGFANLLENCRNHEVAHLIYASSSSVYGGNQKVPFAESDQVDYPVSLYAATKKSNELMAHSYAHLYGIPVTGLRFFTVYGPWGRPDMAYYKFTEAITNDRAIDVYNHGDMERDFTYVDDVVESIHRLLDMPPETDAHKQVPYHLFNIGNHTPVKLMTFIQTLEEVLGKKAKTNLLPMQPGDVPRTYADVSSLKSYVGFEPATSIKEGLTAFVKWYQNYNEFKKGEP